MWGALYKHHQFCKRVEIFFPPQQFVSAQGRGYKPVIQLQAQQGVQSCTKELQKNHPTSRKAGKAQSHLPEYLGSKICTEKSSQVCLWQKLEDATDEKCPMSNESLNPNQTKSLWWLSRDKSCPFVLPVGWQFCLQAARQLCGSHRNNTTNNLSATTLDQNFNEALNPQKGLCVT